MILAEYLSPRQAVQAPQHRQSRVEVNRQKKELRLTVSAFPIQHSLHKGHGLRQIPFSGNREPGHFLASLVVDRVGGQRPGLRFGAAERCSPS